MTDERGIVQVDGVEVEISRPDKLLWPEPGITKLIYLQKLAALSPYLLPYCRDRHLTTRRFPHGVQGKFFYQKNAPGGRPDYVRTHLYEGVEYVNLDSLPVLLWLGNLAALEFHPSFETVHGEEPQEWVIDVDPEREGDPRLMEAAARVGEALEGMGLCSFPKTSGASGVQVVVPLTEGHTFEDLHRVGGFLARFLAEKFRTLFTVERLLKEREGRIYLDYVQVAAGKSMAAPYTPRATPEATVSTPLTWDEVKTGVSPKAFHLLSIEKRLAEKGDLLAQAERQSLAPILKFLEKRPAALGR
ncbi:DNA polymerase domain-containing protein [Paenibacillus mucilaginosus]|uniref:non-homologous end-joining DNA ligase n=1 Tax=Paenibacillus mucilaginosus TaxID=61624 RepID=UPI00240E2FE4|nr:non-homologous end-joining DNA ligase [Paenibacillus mucilaginosus]WFA20206.1 DNA polymerase domain-containing protein [Paenibacillus mucilaginosus]